MSLSLSTKELDGEFSAGTKLALEITADNAVIWPTGAIDDNPERLILTIQTTAANQVVNLGFVFGRYEPHYSTDAKSNVSVNGLIRWERTGKTYRFYGNEGYAENANNPLVHTYATAGTYQITVAGKIKWSAEIPWSNSHNGTGIPAHGLHNFLTKIEIGTNATSPIYDVTCRGFYQYAKLTSIPAGLFDKCTKNTSFEGLFSGCSLLSSLPTGLFSKCTAATNFAGLFIDCAKLTTVPNNFFDANIKVTQFDSTFRGSRLTTIPNNLFVKNTLAHRFDFCFQNTKIAAIPTGLFNTCTAVTTFESTFAGCTLLKAIPNNLFDLNVAATNFASCFDGCTQLTTIPAAVFTKNTRVTNFNYTFRNCTAFTGTLPTLWTSHASTATNHTQCFCGDQRAVNYHLALIAGWGCANEGVMTLTVNTTAANQVVDLGYTLGTFTGTNHSVTTNGRLYWGEGTPVILTENMGATNANLRHTYSAAGNHTIHITGVVKWNWQSSYTGAIHLFNYLTAVGIPSGCKSPIYDISTCGFYNCKRLTTIPAGLFENCTKTTDFSNCFNTCSALSSIPTGLFDKCTAITGLSQCFFKCTNLTTVPNNLFSKLVNLMYVIDLFGNCTKFTTIPAGLFSSNAKIQYFDYAFANTKIVSIPSGLFDAAATQARTFNGCFQNCTSLTTIQTNLFIKNTLATNFSYAFNGCTKLSAIPTGLFDANTKITDINNCFCDCTTIKSIPSNIFTKCTLITNLDSCFRNCSAVTSALPTLWSSHGSASHAYCFCGCNNATNYNAAIIAGWACPDDVASQMILTIETTKANQPVNLGYNLGTWRGPVDATTNIFKHGGTVDWGDGSAKYTFTGNEGTANNTSNPLYHVYTKASRYRITIEGSVKWSKFNVNVNNYTNPYADIPNSIAEVLILIEIPEGCNSPIVYIDQLAFAECRKLARVPKNLFGNCTLVKTFDFCFYHCESLSDANISELFHTCNKATSFRHCFDGCIKIYTTNLFYACPNVTDVSYCFYGCTNIIRLIEHTFYKCPLLTSVTGCFSHCTSLTTIDANLFAYNPKITHFNNCFDACTSLQSIPDTLFTKCTNAQNLMSCFRYCSTLTSIPSNLFANCPHITNFTYCFLSCSSVTGNLPALWDAYPNLGTSTVDSPVYGCFTGCSKASNFSTAKSKGWAFGN